MTNDDKTREYVRMMEDKLSDLNFRLHGSSPNDVRSRDDFMRDYARVLYSASFRRLQGKMQLLGIQHTHFFRNRLTHSLEVAQIARAIAAEWNLSTTAIVETCSLAHDIGNPPFGHAGETVLRDISKGIGGFEGNAQTFRILNSIEKKHYKFRGLNLTFRTLLGIVKYYEKAERDANGNVISKKFLYDSDYELIQNILYQQGLNEKDAKSIDMQIMDLADQIAYGAHDLEDCLNLCIFSIDELLYEFMISEKYRSAYDQLLRIVNNCREFAKQASYYSSSEEYYAIFKKELTSQLVNTFIKDIRYSDKKDSLDFTEYKTLAEGLKSLVFYLILRRPHVQAYEKAGEKVIKGLYEVYIDEKFNCGLKFMPAEYRICEDETERARNVIDFIAGMMDQFAVQEYTKYYGEGEFNKLYPVG